METLRLYNDGRNWLARTDDPRVIETFGTDIIPTAFRAAAPAETVLATLRKLNPDSRVELYARRV